MDESSSGGEVGTGFSYSYIFCLAASMVSYPFLSCADSERRLKIPRTFGEKKRLEKPSYLTGMTEFRLFELEYHG